VNTGWSGGPYGKGRRIKLGHTRAIIRAILSGAAKDIQTRPDPVFGVNVPVACPGVPAEILHPRETWKDPLAYDRTARNLAGMFKRNFEANTPEASPQIKAAGPGG
jgi:phosphoenolpyruvate carboxykinase (ATP)